MVMSRAQFAKVHALLQSQGGFTVRPGTGEEITSGISVATYGNERKVPIEASTPETLEEYHHENIPRFEKGASLGGWRSEEHDVLDTPTVYPNTPGGHSRARNHMLMARQEASFHLDDFREEFNPFSPEGRRKSTAQEDGGFQGPHELAEMAQKNPELARQQPEVQAWISMPRVRGRGAAQRSGPSRG